MKNDTYCLLFNGISGITVYNYNLVDSWIRKYSLFFNQRTTTPQFTAKIELATLYTFDIG
jgi:hypothetical protein